MEHEHLLICRWPFIIVDKVLDKCRNWKVCLLSLQVMTITKMSHLVSIYVYTRDVFWGLALELSLVDVMQIDHSPVSNQNL